MPYRTTQNQETLTVFLWMGLFFGAPLLLFSFWVSWSEKREATRRKKARCAHGVIGAVAEPKLCSTCVQEADAARIAKSKELEALQVARAERYHKWVQQLRLPGYLRRMHPAEFESLSCRLFSKLGYSVEPTVYVGDHGSDGFLTKDGKRLVLQCKRVKGSVGEPVIRDIYGTMLHSGCTGAVVVTTGTVSKQARAWIAHDQKPIQIIELTELEKLVRENFNEDEVVPVDFEMRKADIPKRRTWYGYRRFRRR